MKIKVVIVIDHLGMGGAQSQIIEYLKYADREGFVVEIVNLDASYNIWGEEIIRLQIPLHHIPHKGFFNLTTLMSLIRLFRDIKPDIVHTYLFTADCYGRLAAKWVGVPHIICSIRAFDTWKKFHHTLVDKALALITDKIVVNSNELISFLKETAGIKESKVVRIYNGMDLNRFINLRSSLEVKAEFQIPQDALVVGMVGRFSDHKDYESYFKAASQIIQESDNIFFLAVGDGPLKEQLEVLKDSLHLGKQMVLTGFRKDTPDIINALDIGVLSTPMEGCPNVVMEMMSCRKPVIATKAGGCIDLIVEGETGFLFPHKDVDTLVDQLKLLIGDAELRLKMGEAGRKRVEDEFTSQRLAKSIERLYKSFYSKTRIGFLLSQFPETHETFILREFVGMKKAGLDFDIYSLKECRDEIVHPQAREFLSMTYYAHYLGIVSTLGILLIFPGRFIHAYACCVLTHILRPKDFIKAHIVFMRSAYFARLMKKNGIGHIHAHWATMPATSAEAISIFLKIPFSFTAHAWDIFLNTKSQLKRKISKARFVVTCTRFNRHYLKGLLGGEEVNRKVIANYHGIDLSEFQLRKTKRLRGPALILAVGRLVEQKGFEYLIKACGILKRKGYKYQCMIAGNGPLKKELLELINNFGLNGHVELAGSMSQEKIKELFQNAEVFAAPSVVAQDGDRDGIPNVIIEAMAMGVPIVSTGVSGIPELVIHQETGLVVPPRQDMHLAKALEEILTRRADVARFIENGRRKVEDLFDDRKNIVSLIEIFKQHGTWAE